MVDSTIGQSPYRPLQENKVLWLLSHSMNILGKERRGRNGAPQKKERGFGGAESMIVSFPDGAPRRAAGGNRNGIGKPFGASLIDDLVPRKKGPPIKGRISTQRWDRDAWAALQHGFSGARKAKIVCTT